MDTNTREQILALTCKLIQQINLRNQGALQKEYKISGVVFNEIIENLEEYFGENFSISPPPIQTAFKKNKDNRINIDIFEMNTLHHYGIECVLWHNEAPQEVILHAEAIDINGNIQISYQYIGS